MRRHLAGVPSHPGGRVQLIAGGVVARDHHHAGRAVLGSQPCPLVGHSVERVALAASLTGV
jgi:hypothetical protein